MKYHSYRMGDPMDKGSYVVRSDNGEVAQIYDGYHGSLDPKLARMAAEHLAAWLNEADRMVYEKIQRGARQDGGN